MAEPAARPAAADGRRLRRERVACAASAAAVAAADGVSAAEFVAVQHGVLLQTAGGKDEDLPTLLPSAVAASETPHGANAASSPAACTISADGPTTSK